MDPSIREIWRGNPWWAKVLLAVVALFLLEAVGLVEDIGLAALYLTAIAFLFSMSRTLGELSSTLQRMETTLQRMGDNPPANRDEAVTSMPKFGRLDHPTLFARNRPTALGR